MLAGSPYYFRDPKWLQGLKPQLVVPPLESLVGKYTWLETDSYELVGPELNRSLILELKDPYASASLNNTGGRIGGFSSGGTLVAAKRMKDENDVEYWELEVTGEKAEDSSRDYEPGGRFWRLYVSVHDAESGYPFVEIQEVNGTQYAYGKRKRNDYDPYGLTDAEQERLNFLPVSRASLGRREYQEIKREAFVQDEDIEAGHDDPKQHGAPWYTQDDGDDDDECQGFEPRETVPPLEELFGRYAWAETGADYPWGPCLKAGITLEAKDTKEEAISTNVGGYLGELPLSGAILEAKKKKDEQGNEYWELEVAGDMDEDIEYDSDDGNGTEWHMYVSKVLDDNGHPFLQLMGVDEYSRCGGPYGYAKRQIPGAKVVGFSESEKERINFMTDEEHDAHLRAGNEEHSEEETKKVEEGPKQRDAKKQDQNAGKKEARKAKKERKRQAQQQDNKGQEHNQKASYTSSQQDGRASSAVQSGSLVIKRESSVQVSNASATSNSNSGRQTPDGQGTSRSARKRANKRRREEEARQQQQRQATGVVGYGGVWPPLYFQYPPPHVSNGARTFGNMPYPVDQRPSIKAEPMATGMVWEGTSSQQNGNRNLKRKRSDDESNFKRVKRG